MSNQLLKIFVCHNGDCCDRRIAEETLSQLEQIIEEQHLNSFDAPTRVKAVRSNCLDVCRDGPIVLVHPPGDYYSRIPVSEVRSWLLDYILANQIDDRFHLKR